MTSSIVLLLLELLLVDSSFQTYTHAATTTTTPPLTTSTISLLTTTPAPDQLSAPILVSRTTHSLTVNWNGTAQFYMLQHAEWWDTLNNSLPNIISQNTATATRLLAGHIYALRVIAFNAVSGVGGVAGPTTYLATIPNPTGVPTAARSATANSTKATVSWTNPANTKWDNVTVSCQPSCTPQTVFKPADTVDITGLTPGETYTFITAVSSDGVESTPSRTSALLIMVPNPTDVPTAVRSSTANSTAATVSWTNPANTVWDDVTVSCQPSCTPQTVSNTTATVDITGLTPGERYTFVSVVSSHGVESTPSRTSAPLTMIPSPTDVPTAVRSSTDSSTIATVSWTSPANTVWDVVTVSCQPSCTPQTVSNTTVTVDITGLTPGETYTFITVVSSSGIESTPSRTSAPLIMTPNTTDAPAAVRSSTDNSTTATVAWTNPANTKWDDVTVSCEPSCTPQTVPNTTAAVDITGLTPGETYTFITVVSSSGVESTPRRTSARLIMIPSHPISFQASAIHQTITLFWNYHPGHIASGFFLQCEPELDGCSSTSWKHVGDRTARAFDLNGAQYSQSYKFTLKAESGSAGSEVYSSGASTSITTESDGPSYLQIIDKSRDTIILKWDAPTDPSYVLSYYRLYWNATDGASSASQDTIDSNTTILTATRLQPGFSYEFSVRSYSNFEGLSPPTNLVPFTTYPSEVAGIALAGATSSSLTFIWSFRNRYDGFDFVLSPEAPHSQGETGVLTGQADVYAVTYYKLLMDTEYTFKVRTKVEDAANVTSYKYSKSNFAVGLTDESIPDLVDNLRKVNSTNSSITIGWDPPVQQNGVVIGYVLQRYNGSKNQCARSVFFNCTDCQRRVHDYSTTVISLTSQCSQQDPEMSYTTTDRLSYMFLGLKVYTNYKFKVFAINTRGYSVDEILLTTNEGVSANLQVDFKYVSRSPHSVDLAWNHNSEVREYVLIYDLSTDIATKSIVTTHVSKDVHQFVVSSLQPDSLYQFNLTAYKDGYEEREGEPPFVLSVKTLAAGVNGWQVGTITLLVIVIGLICPLTFLVIRHVKQTQKRRSLKKNPQIPQTDAVYDEVRDVVELNGIYVNSFPENATNNFEEAGETYETPQDTSDVHHYDVVNKV